MCQVKFSLIQLSHLSLALFLLLLYISPIVLPDATDAGIRGLLLFLRFPSQRNAATKRASDKGDVFVYQGPPTQ